jgi:Rrf2 family protein
MRLTAKSEYGLLALVHLSREEGDGADPTPVSAREIAASENIPIKFLEQLLVTLRKAGLVTATRGAHGGFVLGKPAADIAVLDIVEALEGPLSPSPCDGTRECGHTSGCAAAPVWEQAGQALRDVLGSTSVASLATRQTELDAATAAKAG